jgi:hypothetical protein
MYTEPTFGVEKTEKKRTRPLDRAVYGNESRIRLIFTTAECIRAWEIKELDGE